MNSVTINGWFNFGNSITQNTIISGRNLVIEPLSEFISHYPEQTEHISCDKLQVVMGKIKNGPSNVLLLAMSGMGKTRLVYEAFKENTPEKAFYCAHSQGNQFFSDLSLLLKDHADKDSLLVFDNCPSNSIVSIIGLCSDCGVNPRMVFINNDFFERPQIPGLEIVDFRSDDMRNEVDKYIDREVFHNEADYFICKKIKDMADGYPQMAILLVEAYKNKGRIEVNDVGILLNKILGNINDDQMNALKCLAIFQPLGCRPPHQQQLEAVLNSAILTGLSGDIDSRLNVFDRCINHFKGEIIEVGSSWVNVRPLPLAIWLVEKWMLDHSDEMLLRVIDEFRAFPERISVQLAEAMYSRLRNMEGNDKAALMVQEIEKRYENNPFGLAEVVCSDLGSRLFLAFAHVNYQATTNIISVALENKSIEDLKNNVVGNVRRNIVWTLEKLCYPSDSFMKAAMTLARLAIAENEDIGNNAIGQLTQLFHVLLPGTEASLEGRLTLLKEMVAQKETYAPIILPCLSHALLSGSFSRMGGAEQYALTQRKDYMPKKEEITNYWMACSQLIVDYLELNTRNLLEVKKIVEDRCYQLLHKGEVPVVNRLIEPVFKRLDGEWMEMYQHLVKAKKYFYTAYSNENKEIIDYWIEKLAPKNLFNELKEVRLKVFDDNKASYEERYNYAQKLMTPLAEKFVSERLYDNEERVRELIDDYEYSDFGFSNLILSKMDNGALKELLDNIYQVILSKEDNVTSPFLYYLCRNLYDKESYESFLSKLRDSNKEQTYIHLLANNEGEGLTSFHRIEQEIAQGEVNKSAIVTYLNQVGYATPDSMLEMLRSKTVAKYATTSEIIKYLERFQFGFDFSNKDLNDAIKCILLEYEYDEKQPSLNWNYSDFLVRFLEKDHDPKFAKAVSHKMIELLNQYYTHSNFERIFPTLLNLYIDDIWEDFSKCLVSEDYSLFFYQVKDVIGSGMSFGSGPLFQHGDERIKSLCVNYPDHAPYCIALMAPVFHFLEDDEGNVSQEKRFSDIVLWLLEEFGNDKDTLDGLGANMGTYSWVGSPVSLYQSQISCLQSLLSNPKMSREVKEWAQLSISDLQRQINAEQSRLDYERMHYK